MSKRWDQMTTRQRCYLLFRRIDDNTRAVAKLGSAMWYLTSDESDLESLRACAPRAVGEAAPDLGVALRTVMRERRVLRDAMENELEVLRQEKAAAEVAAAGRSHG
jgi:hypothetical protein